MLNRTQTNFFYIILSIVGLVVILMFAPYFAPLFLAGVVAIVCRPLYLRAYVFFRGRENLAAFSTVIAISLLILVPLGALGFSITSEIKDIYSYLTDGGGSLVIIDYLGQAQAFLDRFLPQGMIPVTTLSDFENYLTNIYNWFGTHFQGIFSNALILAGNIFIFIMAFFFFLRDGKKFGELILKISPLENIHDNAIIAKVSTSVNSIVRGTILVAVVQGLLAMLGLWIVGVPSPILWGTLTIFASLIPSVGTMIVMVPACIFIFFASGFGWALALAIWSIVVVGLVDNVMRPYILERGINIHPFLILLSVFGGINLFGVSGLLLGPIVLSVLYALTDMYSEVMSPKTPR